MSNTEMTITNAKIERYSETHMMGTAQINLKSGTEEVLFVAPLPEGELQLHAEPALDHNARFFSSPLIAKTHMEDVCKGRDSVPAFTGRDLGAMQEHLTRQAK